MSGVDRKPQILNEASELLLSRSFTAFSYKDLSARLRISKASIHHHFATKEELLLALVARYRERQRARLEAIDDEHEGVRERLDAFFDLTRGFAESGAKICPVGALQSEFNVIPESAHEDLRQLFEVPKRWLSGLLAEGREQGKMQFAGSPDEQAVLILAALQGALQVTRAQGTAAYEVVVGQLRANLGLEGSSRTSTSTSAEHEAQNKV